MTVLSRRQKTRPVRVVVSGEPRRSRRSRESPHGRAIFSCARKATGSTPEGKENFDRVFGWAFDPPAAAAAAAAVPVRGGWGWRIAFRQTFVPDCKIWRAPFSAQQASSMSEPTPLPPAPLSHSLGCHPRPPSPGQCRTGPRTAYPGWNMYGVIGQLGSSCQHRAPLPPPRRSEEA